VLAWHPKHVYDAIIKKRRKRRKKKRREKEEGREGRERGEEEGGRVEASKKAQQATSKALKAK